jgi:hypothetical protein
VVKPSRQLVVVIVSVVAVLGGVVWLSSAASLSGIQQQLSQSDKTQEPDVEAFQREFRQRFPTTDYNAPEPTNPSDKAKQSKRNKHYDGRHLVARHPYDDTTAVSVHDDAFMALPALPIAESGVILIADVLNSEAHLSNDKLGVYSEFNVQVDRVLKGSVPTLSQSNLISVSRFGGIVQYPSGPTVHYFIQMQSMPAVGKKYLFFLKATEDLDGFEIVTGYDIGPAQVTPLDFNSTFNTFKGKSTADFLEAVRNAIANN